MRSPSGWALRRGRSRRFCTKRGNDCRSSSALATDTTKPPARQWTKGQRKDAGMPWSEDEFRRALEGAADRARPDPDALGMLRARVHRRERTRTFGYAFAGA